MSRVTHAVCLNHDLAQIDVRLDGLRRARTLSLLPATSLRAKPDKRLRVAFARPVDPSDLIVRICPDTGDRLTVVRWKENGDGTPGCVGLELRRRGEHVAFTLCEPLRIHPSGPDLGPGDASWIEDVAGLLQIHRDRVSGDPSRTHPNAFGRVHRMVRVAAISATRGGVRDRLDRLRAPSPGTAGHMAELSPPSPYSAASLVATARSRRNQPIALGPSDAIASDLASLPDVVCMRISNSSLADRLEIEPYGALLHRLVDDTRDAMERLRDLREFAIDRVDLHPV